MDIFGKNPVCPKCELSKITFKYIPGMNGDTLYIIFCAECGHIVGCTATNGTLETQKRESAFIKAELIERELQEKGMF